MSTTLERRLNEIETLLGRLPDPKEPPPTTLQVLDRGRSENDWQRLLFHLLSPDRAHGLDHALLQHLLVGLSDRADLDYTFSSFDLDDIQIEREVTTERGRPDAVIWAGKEWFICWELKVGATESSGQTQGYVEAKSFSGIGLGKEDVPSESHFYVYLAPEGADPPAASEFVPITWEWVASELQSFVSESQGEYPARTTAQLDDFIDTIRSELTMTEFQENQRDKAELYLDYVDEISEVQEAFENQWTRFSKNWGTQLVESMENAEILKKPDLSQEALAVEIDLDGGGSQSWIIRQGMSDWGEILKDGWWRSTDDLVNVYEQPEDGGFAGVSFYHRLDENRELAIEDKTLEIQFYHASANSDGFKREFNQEFSDRKEDVKSALPKTAAISRVSDATWKLFTARYDIREENHEDFFQAYVGALNEAFRDLAIKNQTLVSLIDDIYDHSIDIYRD